MPKAGKNKNAKDTNTDKAVVAKEKEKPETTGTPETAGKPEPGVTPDTAAPPKPKKPAAAKKGTPAEALTAFLAERAITDEQSLAALKKCGILSLDDLAQAKTDGKVRQEVETALGGSGSKFGLARFQALKVEAINNAVYFVKNPGAKETTQSLLDFLADKEVLAEPERRDELLQIFLKQGVTSLAGLQQVKASGQAKLAALTDQITTWKGEAGEKFKKITASAVAQAAMGAPEQVDEDLQAFLKEKAKMPSGSEGVLAKYGVTSLEQLKQVRKDPEQWQELAKRLEDSGILKAKDTFQQIKIEDIDQQIGTVNSPATKEAKKKQAALLNAIEKVKELRTQVESTANDNLSGTAAVVAKEYNDVLGKVKDTCAVEFTAAKTTDQASRSALLNLFDRTIGDAEQASKVLKHVDKTQLPLTQLIPLREMLNGALITPASFTMKVRHELVLVPNMPDELAKGPEAQESITIKHFGSETSSFGSSFASQTGSAFSTSVDTAAAGFVGSGLGAVSAAASYSEVKKASQDQEDFKRGAVNTCGETRYLYEPKQTIQFRESDIRLSENANRELMAIASTPDAASRTSKIKGFYKDFGSHFFTRYSLGGRYEFKATGTSESSAGKQKMVRAVSQGTTWATSASGSFAAPGAVVTGAASATGSATEAHAAGERMEYTIDDVDITVQIKILGGAGRGPRDLWSESLAFNSTWTVIGRAEPIAIWEIVERIPQSPRLPPNLAPLLEEVWIQVIFRDAVRESNPALFARIGAKPEIKTCEALNAVMKALQTEVPAEPPVEIVIVQKTSTSGEHPKIVAQSTTRGLKLIGGGARVNSSGGAGNLLTGSFPNGEGWEARAKSHKAPSAATVTAYAIYLVDPDDVWDVCRIEAKTELKSGRPEATAMLKPGYVLTGGGALLDDFGPGVMLTHCGPATNNGLWGWRAKGKDHAELTDTAHATAWAFGIRPKNMAAGTNPKPPQMYTQMASQASHPKVAARAGEKAIVIGGGASVAYRGPGGLLTATYPDVNRTEWSASAADHIHSDTLDLTVWSIFRPGQVKK